MKLLVGVILPPYFNPATAVPAEAYVLTAMTKFDRRAAVEPFLEECQCSAHAARATAAQYANRRCGEYIKSRELKRDWTETYMDHLQYVGLLPDPHCRVCHGEGVVEVFTNKFGRVDNWRIGGDHYGNWMAALHREITYETLLDNITAVSNVRLNKAFIFPLHYVTPDGEWLDCAEREWGKVRLKPWDDNFVVLVEANDYEA